MINYGSKIIVSKINCSLFLSYAMDGLSADKLRVLLNPIKEEKKAVKVKKDNDDDVDRFDVQETKESMEEEFRDIMVLATLQDGTRGLWKTAQVMYSFAMPHKVRKCLIY